MQLLAFVVGDFGYIETKTAAGVPVRVYAPSGMEKDGKFSLDLAAKTLDFFGKEFGSPYPLPKMDMVPAHLKRDLQKGCYSRFFSWSNGGYPPSDYSGDCRIGD